MMNTETGKEELLKTDEPVAQSLPTEKEEGESEKPVDYRRVQHGHGPCSCCGPYSE
jgi:hypothetical protein